MFHIPPWRWGNKQSVKPTNNNKSQITQSVAANKQGWFQTFVNNHIFVLFQHIKLEYKQP